MNVERIKHENELIAKLMTAASAYESENVGYSREYRLNIIANMLVSAGMTIVDAPTDEAETPKTDSPGGLSIVVNITENANPDSIARVLGAVDRYSRR